MKTYEKPKKDKLLITKPQTSDYSFSKKPQLKKRRQESYLAKNLNFVSQPKIGIGMLSGMQSAKLSHPSLSKLKNNPKSSLGQLKSYQAQRITIPDSKIKKIEMAEKNKQQIKKSLSNVIQGYYPQKKISVDVSITEVTKDTQTKEQKLSKNQFKFIQIIGQGGYGKVWKVRSLKNNKYYAMKQMNKAIVVMKKSVDNVLNQRKILEELSNPFISNIICAFNDRDNLFLVMDLLSGADLRYKIGLINVFTEEQSIFIIGCLLTALDYIHRNGIFHRDIKPENLVFDDHGFMRLTDFGIARNLKANQTLDASGTPGYMAPQVLCKQIHSYEVDYYAVGVIAYELMMGKRPYIGNNRNEIRDAVFSKQHSIKKSQIPIGWSIDSADFVNRLIMRTPSTRLGSKGGVKQIKSHPWFSGFNWQKLEMRKMKSPFRDHEQYIDHSSDRVDEYSEAMMQFKLLQRAEKNVDAFSKYYFQRKQK